MNWGEPLLTTWLHLSSALWKHKDWETAPLAGDSTCLMAPEASSFLCLCPPAIPCFWSPGFTVVSQNLSPETTGAYKVMRWGRLRENPGRLYYFIIVSQYLGGQASLKSQDCHRHSNFHKDLRTVDILNMSQGPSTPPTPSHPTAVWALYCSLSVQLRPTAHSCWPRSEVPRTVLRVLWLSAGFGRRGACRSRLSGERGCLCMCLPRMALPALSGPGSCLGCSATAPPWPVLPFCHSRSRGCPGPTETDSSPE